VKLFSVHQFDKKYFEVRSICQDAVFRLEVRKEILIRRSIVICNTSTKYYVVLRSKTVVRYVFLIWATYSVTEKYICPLNLDDFSRGQQE
jgi:hypothetical protein